MTPSTPRPQQKLDKPRGRAKLGTPIAEPNIEYFNSPRLHFMRNALAYAGKTQRRLVSAWVSIALCAGRAAVAHKQWREVADQARPRVSNLAALVDDAQADVLADMSFPAKHRAKIHSTNPIDRINGEIKRRSDVVGIFPDEAALTRLIGAILPEQNDGRAVQRAR